jgi:two-component system, LytTR family, response regulator
MNPMIRTIIIDDEARGINSLRKMIEMHCPDLQIVAECQDAKQALESIKMQNPQLIFLDIAMPGKSGLDMLNELKEIWFEIIFVSAHSQYSIRAFKFSAVDYLLKPVDETLLIQAVQRAATRIESHAVSGNIDALFYNLQKIHKPADMKLCITSLKGFQVIQLSDILYCEGVSSYTIFHMMNGRQFTASRSIVDYELLLEDNFFCRIHKSYIINLTHVLEYKKGEGGVVRLTNGKEVEVSRRKKEIFLARIKDLFKM